MKRVVLLIAAVTLGTLCVQAASTENETTSSTMYGYGNSFIFTEGGVTFSVYLDGEFDFYLNNRIRSNATAYAGNVNVTFNSGYNYNPYVQYDDYGAVIQVERIPIYYDYYGRVSRIGGVALRYANGTLCGLGGLYIHYNGGVVSHCSGFINRYNRHYVYRPFHRYFVRPAARFCNVYHRPYRRYYRPVRYSYYRPYTYNPRRVVVSVGNTCRSTPRYRSYRHHPRVTVRNKTSARQ